LLDPARTENKRRLTPFSRQRNQILKQVKNDSPCEWQITPDSFLFYIKYETEGNEISSRYSGN
jgi:hypothetical protein